MAVDLSLWTPQYNENEYISAIFSNDCFLTAVDNLDLVGGEQVVLSRGFWLYYPSGNSYSVYNGESSVRCKSNSTFYVSVGEYGATVHYVNEYNNNGQKFYMWPWSFNDPDVYIVEEEEPGEEPSKYQFAHGDGTGENPYEIWTHKDLAGMYDYRLSLDEYAVLESSNIYFKQMADIDLSNYNNWAIYSMDMESFFSINYHGNGFEIKNMKMNLTEEVGYTSFFGITAPSSVLKGINLKDYTINCCGHAETSFYISVISTFYGKIENCSAKGVINFDGVGMGVICGLALYGILINNCYSFCEVNTINVPEDSGYTVVGIAYYSFDINGNMALLENCYSVLQINGDGNFEIKGVCGGTTFASYYNSDFITPEVEVEYGGIPKTTVEMKQKETYENWDFDTIWDIDGVTNDGYPFLRGQKPSDGYNLTITVEGNGTTSPQAGTSQHEAGKNVLLIAYPEPGHKLLRWEGYGVEDTESEYTQIKMTANRSVKAVFAEEAILKLVAAGGGTTNPPPGEISYAKGQVVTLKAAPHRGFKFKEWTKDISSTNDVYELLMDGDKTVWAIFDDDEDDKSTKRKLYFATAREKAFWMINGKWRFFATPVHSNLKKLEADDHKHYLNNERHDKVSRHRLGEVVPHDSHENLNNVGYYSHKKIDEHIESMENPHFVTANQVGAIPYLYGDTLPEAGEEYRGFFFTLPGEAGPPEVEDKLYYCRSVDGGTTYEWKEITFV